MLTFTTNMNTSCPSYLKKAFTFDDAHDRPMLDTLLKLENMGWISVKYVPGDGRFTRDTAFLCHSHLRVCVNKPGVELTFPCKVPGITFKHERLPQRGDFCTKEWEWSKIRHPLSAGEYYGDEWGNVCKNCMECGVWGEIVSMSEFHLCSDADSELLSSSGPVCFVGCPDCVKAQGWTWGGIKLKTNDKEIEIKPPCNGGHIPTETILPSGYEHYQEGETFGENFTLNWYEWEAMSQGYGHWGQENTNAQTIVDQYEELCVDGLQLTWGKYLDSVPPYIQDLVIRKTKLLDELFQHPTNQENYWEPIRDKVIEGSPYRPIIFVSPMDTYSYQTNITGEGLYQETRIQDVPQEIEPYDEEGQLHPDERHFVYSEEEEDHMDDTEDIQKRKESASKGLSLLEEVMNGEGKLNEGTYLELCNVFRDIHQN